MFSKDKSGNAAVCLKSYGRLSRGAVVPQSNELYADVEDWLAAGNSLLPFDGYPDTRTLEEIKEAKRLKLKAERDEALNNLVHTFADGKQMQVRPQDKGNIETAISNNVEQKWIMADNTTRLVTVNELQVALEDGVQQGRDIWNKYVDDLEQLMGSK